MPAPRVASSESIIAWYARGEPVTFSDNWTLTTDHLREFVERQKVDFLVLNAKELRNAGLDDQEMSSLPVFLKLLGKAPAFLKIIGEAPSDPRSKDTTKLFVFRVQAE